MGTEFQSSVSLTYLEYSSHFIYYILVISSMVSRCLDFISWHLPTNISEGQSKKNRNFPLLGKAYKLSAKITNLLEC